MLLKQQFRHHSQISCSPRDFVLVVEISLNDAVQSVVLLKYALHRR